MKSYFGSNIKNVKKAQQGMVQQPQQEQQPQGGGEDACAALEQAMQQLPPELQQQAQQAIQSGQCEQFIQMLQQQSQGQDQQQQSAMMKEGGFYFGQDLGSYEDISTAKTALFAINKVVKAQRGARLKRRSDRSQKRLNEYSQEYADGGGEDEALYSKMMREKDKLAKISSRQREMDKLTPEEEAMLAEHRANKLAELEALQEKNSKSPVKEAMLEQNKISMADMLEAATLKEKADKWATELDPEQQKAIDNQKEENYHLKTKDANTYYTDKAEYEKDKAEYEKMQMDKPKVTGVVKEAIANNIINEMIGNGDVGNGEFEEREINKNSWDDYEKDYPNIKMVAEYYESGYPNWNKLSDLQKNKIVFENYNKIQNLDKIQILDIKNTKSNDFVKKKIKELILNMYPDVSDEQLDSIIDNFRKDYKSERSNKTRSGSLIENAIGYHPNNYDNNKNYTVKNNIDEYIKREIKKRYPNLSSSQLDTIYNKIKSGKFNLKSNEYENNKMYK